MKPLKGLIIIDFSRTIYDKPNDRLHEGVVDFLEDYGKDYALVLVSSD